VYLKSDFDAALVAAVLARPKAAEAYRAGLPILLAQMDAWATQAAMLSQQIDLAEVEPFIKARTGTVLADAALKGVLPLARPARVQITVTNPGPDAVPVPIGRGILDGKGRRYVVDGAATIAADSTGTITAQQVTTRTVPHTVSGAGPFYSVQVPPSPDDADLTGVEVADGVGAFTYAVDFVNSAIGDRVFHAETDEYRRLFLRFGAAGVVGHQPANGDVLTMTIRECAGKIELDAGASFALEYVGNAAEGALSFALNAVLAEGSGPPDTETLRMIARYPALHDANAVYLSNFDFLLRRHLPPVHFLAVWNEQVEETARGPDVENINTLFVSFVIPGQTVGTSEAQIEQIINRADDSYRVQFVDHEPISVPVTVTARVGVVHDAGDVEAQIRATLLAQYGVGSLAASRGLSNVFRFQDINRLLVENVVALQDQISDFSVVFGETPDPLPEDFRHLTAGSITVTVERVSTTTGLWNA
jgi:hypothetical protein